MYLLTAGGLIALIWPRLIAQPADWPHMNSVVACMLAGVLATRCK